MHILCHDRSDTTLNYPEFQCSCEAMKQRFWIVLHDSTSTRQASPLQGWRSTYGPKLQIISAANVDHDILVQASGELLPVHLLLLQRPPDQLLVPMDSAEGHWNYVFMLTG
ncbi:hypothetical protein BDQ17DRAFT_167575 [Cyathus striatus]|nr:hypothetical protein BDQ17DRAFT_167575 [Cyathus striatus]